mgnify:FL=1
MASSDARGRLVSHINGESHAGRDLMTKGWTIVRVCSSEEAAELAGRVHDDLERLGTGIDRHDTRTWTADRWPQTTHGLIQNQGSGLWPSVCAARLKTRWVWETELFSGPCIASWDALSFAKPTYQAYAAKHGWDADAPTLSSWLHTDQAKHKPQLLHHIQGALALTALGAAELRTQIVAPPEGETAQAFRDRFLAAFPPPPLDQKKRKKGFDAEREEWIAHTADEKRWLADNGTPVAPQLEAGEMVLWASGMPHASVAGTLPANQDTHNPRISVFVSALPRRILSHAEVKYRQALLEKGVTSGHRVCEPGVRAGTFRQCLFSRIGRVYEGRRVPEYADIALKDFARADASVDAVHAGTAQFCGGYPRP